MVCSIQRYKDYYWALQERISECLFVLVYKKRHITSQVLFWIANEFPFHANCCFNCSACPNHSTTSNPRKHSYYCRGLTWEVWGRSWGRRQGGWCHSCPLGWSLLQGGRPCGWTLDSESKCLCWQAWLASPLSLLHLEVTLCTQEGNYKIFMSLVNQHPWAKNS